MNLAATALLSLALSSDAFAVAIGKGAALHKPHWREALRCGLIFGVIEGLTPIIGWMMGRLAAPYVTAWDHWIAFALLGALGVYMVFNSLARPNPEIAKPTRHALWLLIVAGIATSIDAMVVGASLALVNADIIVTATAIGLTTFAMVSIGIMLGRMLGAVVGRRAELIGGLILITIGSLILYEHVGLSA
ncbi:MAG: manganese efflux pump MntP family protein [Herbaspirillum sp.]